MGLFTPFSEPPAPPYQNELTPQVYRLVWHLHKATTHTQRVNSNLQTVGLGIYRTGLRNQVFTHAECLEAFKTTHSALLNMLNYFRLEDYQYAALLSLGMSLGPVGLAGSRVIWDLVHGDWDALEVSWQRYVWFPANLMDEMVRRNIEYRCFTHGWDEPLVRHVLNQTEWDQTTYLALRK